ncbi:MAG TPA: ROK family protein [Methanomicrobiales archaeon]|nr:ROK family protein [Methanomicrobiales archaeon]
MPAAGEDDRPVVAVDLGATTTRVALFGHGGVILGRVASPTPASGHSPDVVTRHLSSLIRDLLSAHREISPIAIGVSAAGPIDHRRGSLVRPPNLPFPEVSLERPLRAEFGIPVRLANDCHAGVLGEVVFGAGAGCRDLAYITLSTGIGGGIVCNGRLVLGRDGNAAEIGHFHVDSTWNLPCGCGGTGHWEGYASGRFIPRFFALWCESEGIDPAGIDNSSAAGIFTAAGQGHPAALGFMKALGEINGRGISDVIVAYDPSRMILDGSVVLKNPDLVIRNLLPCIDRFLPTPEIRVTSLDGLAPLYGASVLARGYDTPIGSLLPG